MQLIEWTALKKCCEVKQTWNHGGSSSENENVAYPEFLTGNAFTSACNSETHWQKSSFKLRMHGPEGCVLQRKRFWYLVILLNHKLCLGNSNLRLHRLNHFLQQQFPNYRQLAPLGQWSYGHRSATKSCTNSLVPCGCALGPPLTQNFMTRGSQMRWEDILLSWDCLLSASCSCTWGGSQQLCPGGQPPSWPPPRGAVQLAGSTGTLLPLFGFKHIQCNETRFNQPCMSTTLK